MISLDKCNGGCNVVDYLLKICVPSETNDVNVKVFNKVTRINQAKALIKHLCNCKCKLDSTTCNSDQKWNNDKHQCQCKTVWHVQKRL